VGAMLASPFLALLTPLYFVAVGLKANFTTDFDPLLTFAITTVACVGKAVGGSFGAWCGGLGRQAALAVGFGMNARGAMAIILATVALDHHLIDGRVFVSLVFMALFTSLISGPIMGYLLRQDKE
jgi:Kef-type K+ transport system membrane component KefB